ncbi:TetR/AcrR family transcriptional regulator [Lacisediminihabitans sp.]|uniref:TetR/AcrR family transcriptional regulator n=1 Tax=Lacisediminihabitans sp. TaxID=2787631 RepID=UPI00374D51B8
MGRQRTFSEIDVLTAVEKSFWSKGYASTSLGDIMVATGLGKGSIYSAFGDKYGIFRRVFDRYCETVELSTATALAGPDESALQRLVDMLLRAASRAGGDEPLLACFLAKTTAELAQTDAEVAARSRQAFDTIGQSIIACVEQAQRTGDIDPTADSTRLGRHILVTLRGIEALVEAGVPSDVVVDAASVTIDVLRSGGST